MNKDHFENNASFYNEKADHFTPQLINYGITVNLIITSLKQRLHFIGYAMSYHTSKINLYSFGFYNTKYWTLPILL